MSQHIAEAIRQLRRASAMRALYPEGHPIYASSVEKAREAVATLLGDQDQVALTFIGGTLGFAGEPVEGEDEAIRQLVDSWWRQGISGLTVRQGLTDEEIDILLQMSAGDAEGLGITAIKERLEAVRGTHLIPTETDYERFVPQSRVPEELGNELSASDSRSVLWDLMTGALGPGTEPDDESRRALDALLEDPSTLADAIQSGILGADVSRGAVTESDLEDLVFLPVSGPRDEPRSVEGARLATALGQLAEMCAGRDGERLRDICGKLAEVVRRLDPEVVALAFRVREQKRIAGVEVLTEIARHLTVEELVEIVRARPAGVAGEASAVHRRLLRRLSGEGERAAELGSALKGALLADGMSEDVFASTVGIALMEEGAPPDDAGAGEDMAGTLPVGVHRASEADRAARRSEITSELERAFGEAVWADRAVVSLELLAMSDSPRLQAAAAADTKLALRRTPEELRPDVWVHVALEVGRLLDPDSVAGDAQRSAALSVIADTADADLVTALLDFLPLAEVDEHAALFRALAASGEVGRAVLAGLLVERAGTLVNGDVAQIIRALLESEEAGRGGGSELSLALTNPDCWARAEALQLVWERGTEASEAVIREIVRHGDQRVRWDTVFMLGQAPSRSRQALELALHDPDDYIACAAASHLGASGDPRAASALIARLRASHDTEDRFPLRLTLVQALGGLPCAESTEALAEILHAPSFFGRRNNDALRTAAAEALVRIGSPAALNHVAARCGRERCARIRELAGRAARLYTAEPEGRPDTDAA